MEKGRKSLNYRKLLVVLGDAKKIVMPETIGKNRKTKSFVLTGLYIG